MKSEEEQDVIKSAVEASAASHIEMMRKCKPGQRESILMGVFRDHGLFNYNVKFKAYPDIVASGRNAAVLHYEINDRIMQSGDLVLCDCAHRVLLIIIILLGMQLHFGHHDYFSR